MSDGQRGRRNARICDNNHLIDAVVTAPAAVGFPFSNALNAKLRGKVYKPGTNSFTLQIDLNSAKQFSYFALFGEADKVLGLSNAAVITLKANMINHFVGTEPYSKVIPVHDKGCFADLTDAVNLTGQQYRFIQISIDDSTNPDDVSIAYLYLGDHIEFQFNVRQGFEFKPIDLSRRAISDSGVVYGVRKNQYNAFSSMGFLYLTDDDRRKILETTEAIGLTTPWVFVLDPLEIGFNLRFGTLLCYFDELPKLTQAYLNKWNLTFTIREVV